MALHNKLPLTYFFIGAFDVTVTTDIGGPPYKAGLLFNVICNASNGDPPYVYEWSVGCSYTNIFGAYVEDLQTFGAFTTTPIKCKDVFKCRVTDSMSITKVAKITVTPVTGKLRALLYCYFINY